MEFHCAHKFLTHEPTKTQSCCVLCCGGKKKIFLSAGFARFGGDTRSSSEKKQERVVKMSKLFYWHALSWIFSPLSLRGCSRDSLIWSQSIMSLGRAIKSLRRVHSTTHSNKPARDRLSLRSCRLFCFTQNSTIPLTETNLIDKGDKNSESFSASTHFLQLFSFPPTTSFRVSQWELDVIKSHSICVFGAPRVQ